jgi:hypothetical protein
MFVVIADEENYDPVRQPSLARSGDIIDADGPFGRVLYISS